MAAKANIITSADIQVTAREIDFVTRFERNWQHLRDILGIMRPIKKTPGAVLKSKCRRNFTERGCRRRRGNPLQQIYGKGKDICGDDHREVCKGRFH